MIETGILVLVVMAGLWYAWRHRRGRRVVEPSAPENDLVEPMDEAGDAPQMPRLGKPGSATDAQVDQLAANRVIPAPPCVSLHDYSAEEAQLLLDAIAYARAAIQQITCESEPAPADVESDVVAALLADADSREAVTRWGRTGQPIPLKQGATLQRARDVVLRFWQPAPTAGA